MGYSNREKRAKLNIIVTLVCQLLTMVCGIVVPRILITHFGSEAYGATASITQFLSYITLLEGGVSGVARAALYRPLANEDMYQVSLVMSEIKKFFNIIAYIFVVYVLVLAVSFKHISHIEVFDWITTAILVLVISASTFAQYFIGISYSILLQAAQRTYIGYTINIIATIINTVMVVVLTFMGANLIAVKLISSIVFALRPFMMKLYVNQNFKLVKVDNVKSDILKDKWTGLGQHIAYFIHSYTDIAVLTIFANLKLVSVYSVYYMVVNSIQSITASFSTGMEAVFGDMYAKKEYDSLNSTFSLYETLISSVSLLLFSVTAVMIIPFVRLYTNGVTDINYIIPELGILLVVASLIYCLRMPYHSMIIAAGHFKQTKMAAYGEAFINISISIVLVVKHGIIGVAIGTVLAVSFRFVFYALYLSKHIIKRNLLLFVKRELVSVAEFFAILVCGNAINGLFVLINFVNWVFVAIIVTILSIVFIFIGNMLFYRNNMFILLKKLKKQR